jgi:hypothetical protein
MDKLDFLAGESPEDTAPAASPEEPSEGPARGPDGKFVSAAVDEPAADLGQAPEPVAEPIQAAPVPETPPAHVPISALMDERDKRKAMEAELAAERARARERTRQGPPDRWEDPEGYDAYQQAYVQNSTLNVKLDLSEDMARGKHGDEVVNAVQQWAATKFAQSPALQQEILTQRNPYEYAIKLYKQEQTFQQLGDGDLDAFLAWKAQQANPLAPSPPATPAAIPASPAPRPPPSLANAPSAGGAAHTPSGPGQAFSRTFG